MEYHNMHKFIKKCGTVWHEVAELPAELFEVPCSAVDMVARL